MTPDEKAAKAAALRAEADALEKPESQEYPKWIHYDDGRLSVLVPNAAEEAKLNGPADVEDDDVSKKPKPALGKKK